MLIIKLTFFYRLIKQRATAIEIVNLYYGAILYFIYEHWVKDNITLKESGQLLKSRCLQQFY